MFFRLLQLSLNSDCNKFWTFLQRAVVGLSALFIFVFIKNRNGGAAGAEFLLIHFKIVYVVASIVCLISFSEIVQDYRKDETLALLLMTGVSIPKLLLSVFSGKLFLLLAIILVQIPFCLFAVTLGGVTAEAVINLFISSGLWLVLMACLGALLSGIFSSKNESILVGFGFFLGSFIVFDLLGISPLQSLNSIILYSSENYTFTAEAVWGLLALILLSVLVLKFEKYYFSPISFLADKIENFRQSSLSLGYNELSDRINKRKGKNKSIRFDENPIQLKDQYLHPWGENSNVYDFFGAINQTSKYKAVVVIMALTFYLMKRFDLNFMIIHLPLFGFMIISMWMKTFKAFKAEIDEETLSTLLILPMSTLDLLNEKLKYLQKGYAMTIFTYIIFCIFSLLLWFVGASSEYSKFLLMVFCLPILKKSIDYLTLQLIFVDHNSPALSAGAVSFFIALSYFLFPLFTIPAMIIFLLFAKRLLLYSLEKYGESC